MYSFEGASRRPAVFVVRLFYIATGLAVVARLHVNVQTRRGIKKSCSIFIHVLILYNDCFVNLTCKVQRCS